MSENEKLKGPASYFPSIEKKYGFPVNHWFDLLKDQKGLKHMEMVRLVKERAQNRSRSCKRACSSLS